MVLSFLLVKAQNTHPVVQNLWKVVAKTVKFEFVCKARAKLQAKALCCKSPHPWCKNGFLATSFVLCEGEKICFVATRGCILRFLGVLTFAFFLLLQGSCGNVGKQNKKWCNSATHNNQYHGQNASARKQRQNACCKRKQQRVGCVLQRFAKGKFFALLGRYQKHGFFAK